MSLQQVLRDIKSLKIQGAEQVGLAALRSLKSLTFQSRATTPKIFLHQLQKARSSLIATRPTEPYLRNVLKYVIQNTKGKTVRQQKEATLAACNHIIKNAQLNEEIIAKSGAGKVPRGGVAFTHCHSSTVMAVLKQAKKTKKFIVHNTEARPRWQGRLTCQELSKNNIKVVHFADTAARMAIKHSDVMFLGCDAITKKSIVNKIGSELFCEVAERYHVPVYICTDSLKFDPATLHGKSEKLEMRSPNEIWNKPPKNTRILNYAFERIDPKLITGIISEQGIHSHKEFLHQVKHHHRWLLRRG